MFSAKTMSILGALTVYVNVNVYVNICMCISICRCIHIRSCICVYINAGLSGIRSIRERNEKTIDAETGPVPD